MTTITLTGDDDVYDHVDGDEDTIRALTGSDTISTRSDNVLIFGEEGNDRLESYGVGGSLNGGTGDDSLLAFGAWQTLLGGVGDDWYILGSATSTIEEYDGEGIDTVLLDSSITLYQLAANVEYLVGSDADCDLTGNDLANTITSGAGDSRIDGGAGYDVLQGSLGNDTYIINDVTDVMGVLTTDLITENADEGIDAVETSLVAYQLGNNVENLSGTSSLPQTLSGNGCDNIITGGNGDVLNGEDGNDRLIASDLVVGTAIIMNGGTGDDIYVLPATVNASEGSSPFTLVELHDGGMDTVQTSLVFFQLENHFENITDIGADDAQTTKFIGNAAANVMTAGANRVDFFGEAGDDTLIGGAGNDVLDGGAGADLVHGGAGDDTLKAGDNLDILNGDDGDDTLTSYAASTLLGGAGDDVLFGAAGSMQGGDGNDTYHIFGEAVVSDVSGYERYFIRGDGSVVVDLGGGADFFLANSAYATVVTGSAASNYVRDDGWFNDLIGGIGKDTFVLNGIYAEVEALAGDDVITISANSSGHEVYGGDGRDTVMIHGHGNEIFGEAGDDFITSTNRSGIGANMVSGGAGNDVINFAADGAGSNSLFGDSGDDTITGGARGDALNGGDGNDTLAGGTGIDNLQGGGGNDKLSGGWGGDTLSGGWGADQFIYRSIAEGGDQIAYFASNDVMVFKGSAFSGLKPGILDPSMFRSAAAHVARDSNDHFLFDTRTDTLWFDADGSKAGVAKLIADFANDVALKPWDILII